MELKGHNKSEEIKNDKHDRHSQPEFGKILPDKLIPQLLIMKRDGKIY